MFFLQAMRKKLRKNNYSTTMYEAQSCFLCKCVYKTRRILM